MLRAPRNAALLVALVLLAVLPAAAQADAGTRQAQYYVSLGDSYATGFQALGQGRGHNTRNGFANQIPALARRRGYDLELVNFGCAGATTVSILNARGCPVPLRAVGGPRYTSTQTAAAERFLRAHRGRVGLITVSIGGNDVTQCARAADPIKCVGDAQASIKANVGRLVRRLRAAAGTNVPIVGTTYPDVILGQWVSGKPSDQNLAKLSVIAFRNVINPALKDRYESVRNGKFVDVTRATGAYGSLGRTTNLRPYGAIPVPVAEVCRLTYYCQFRDIHARTNGYRIIAQLVAATLPRR